MEKEMVLTAEALSKMIVDGVKAGLAPIAEAMQKLEAGVNKEIHGAGAGASEVKDLKGAEKSARFFKALVYGESAIVKQLAEGEGADGGFLVPTEFRATVVEKQVKASVIRPRATVIPMARDTMEMPVEGAAVVASFTAENDDIDESNPDWGQVKLDVNKLTAISKSSRELFADSAVSIIDYLSRQFAKAFAKAEDKAFTTGSGTGEPKGLTEYSITSVAQSGASVSADDLIALFYKLPSQYRSNAVWIMNNAVIAGVRGLKDENGRYLWTDGLLDAPATILGRPVLEQNDLVADGDEYEIYFGDLSYYLIGDRQTMEVETTTQSDEAFKKHQVHLKAVSRIDGQLGLTEAFVKLTGVTLPTGS